ncbi:UNVERIFIED_CONTAM: hypothetical protein FKN15_076435 [Acipenser sinensis]
MNATLLVPRLYRNRMVKVFITVETDGISSFLQETMGCSSSEYDDDWVENIDEYCEHCNCPIKPDVKPQVWIQNTGHPFVIDLPTDNLVVATYSYEPTHSEDLGFQKGEKLKILSKDGGEWFMAQSLATGKTGFVPHNFVAKLDTMETEP